ncbi:hypothetical protein Cgig2_030205 [Carnegiea gigantea]|uniref:WRKY domain-containing protein n=1 Tax=Carnegiea gigantea TaxID=171969 RepID=A0A9Q1KAC3_9CARY|nr:hypothetical protein Cgig2_030205 [Carnegiea gigantea]
MDGYEFGKSGGDWDLQAIVKGCNSPVISQPWFQSPSHEEDHNKRHENKAFQGATSIHDYAKSPTRVQRKKAVGVSCANSQGRITFVQQVAGDRALSDNWNWRKYGQKTIKGSPYPRSYYKCSSSGDCLARKQVEHSSSDPGTFLITYIDEHNHPYPTQRHSQAGGTKDRFDSSSKVHSTSESSTNKPSTTNTISSLESPLFGDNVRISTLKCEKDEGSSEDGGGGGGGDVDVSNMMWDDEFFAGLEYLEGLEMDLL